MIMERKRVLSKIDIDTDIFMTSFEEAAKLLLEKKYILEKEGWIDIHLKLEYFNDWVEVIAMGMRYENDTEYNERLINEQKKVLSAQKREERERKKYEKLKSKYDS